DPAGRRAIVKFLNRELSWLAFNERVLEEAADPTTPLVERIKFAGIVASNLDEFFMVRVAGLSHLADGNAGPDLARMTPAEQLAAISERAHAMVAALYRLTTCELLPALDVAGARIVSWENLEPRRRVALGDFFRDAILPVLTPLAIDASRPFPLLASLSLNLALRLDAAPDEEQPRRAIVPGPPGLSRLGALDEPGSFVLLEEVISAHLPLLFPGQPILESAVIRLARDAELELDDEGGRTHLEQVEREIRKRRRSDVARLEGSANASDELVALLREPLGITRDEVYSI